MTELSAEGEAPYAFNTPFPYSHGYVVHDESESLDELFTIMAYGPAEKRVPRFSNPQHKYPDENGVVIGVAGEARLPTVPTAQPTRRAASTRPGGSSPTSAAARTAASIRCRRRRICRPPAANTACKSAPPPTALGGRTATTRSLPSLRVPAAPATAK